MDGMGMMLKSLGIDKDKIESDIEAFKTGIENKGSHFTLHLDGIERALMVLDSKLDLIISNQTTIKNPNLVEAGATFVSEATNAIHTLKGV